MRSTVRDSRLRSVDKPYSGLSGWSAFELGSESPILLDWNVRF